jgi:hypothetical protein
VELAHSSLQNGVAVLLAALAALTVLPVLCAVMMAALPVTACDGCAGRVLSAVLCVVPGRRSIAGGGPVSSTSAQLACDTY